MVGLESSILSVGTCPLGSEVTWWWDWGLLLLWPIPGCPKSRPESGASVASSARGPHPGSEPGGPGPSFAVPGGSPASPGDSGVLAVGGGQLWAQVSRSGSRRNHFHALGPDQPLDVLEHLTPPPWSNFCGEGPPGPLNRALSVSGPRAHPGTPAQAPGDPRGHRWVSQKFRVHPRPRSFRINYIPGQGLGGCLSTQQGSGVSGPGWRGGQGQGTSGRGWRAVRGQWSLVGGGCFTQA